MESPNQNGDSTRPGHPSAAREHGVEPIAVIGFSMRFPDEATSPEGFWNILQQGRNVMTEVPRERFNVDGFYHPDATRPDTINARGGHFLKEDIAAFDAPFFSMNPSEVESMDPQQRILLETSYHALENAGIPIHKAAGSQSSVYVGTIGVDYNRLFDVDDEVQPIYKATGNAGSILANRISWFYDLRGPSMTVETACSSSMVALHLACQSLRTGESKMGLVAGSQLFLEPLTSAISLSALKFMSPDSRCLSFDDKGSGYAKGEGFGALILKPLKDAVADGDTVRAVIRASTTNQDGRTPGITQPSPDAQEGQIRDAYKLGGLDFNSTRLFEAHGTGTALGDPIEAEAVRNVFQEHRSRDDPIYIGAVKSNIGHLEAVAGLAGVIKTILCLERGIIPPNAGLETLNRRIKAEEWHLAFPKEAVPWPSNGLRRASVNSFGYGGSNAHVIIDDAYNCLRKFNLHANHCTIETPPACVSDFGRNQPPYQGETIANNVANGSNGTNNHANGTVGENKLQLFVWSTSDSAGVERMSQAYQEYLSRPHSGNSSPDFLRDFSFTLSNKRSVLPWKSYVVADSHEDLVNKLNSIQKPVRSSVPPRVSFIFTGQGAQWANMGLGMLSNPAINESLSQADKHFKTLGSEWSLVEELKKPDESSILSDPALAQPVCTAIQIALVELLASWGVQPQGLVGHSSGEIAAAFCAGAIDRQSAWTIAYFRGFLAAKLAKEPSDSKARGAMMTVALAEEELKPYLDELATKHPEKGHVTIGCENSTNNLTLTGVEAAIDFLKEKLDFDQVFARKLAIPVAYHSSLMQDIAGDYLEHLQPVRRPASHDTARGKGQIKHTPLFISSVTGDVISLNELAKPEYWVKNLISRVRFQSAVTRLHAAASDNSSVGNQAPYCIEIGPHPAMQKAVKDTMQGKEGFQYDATLRRGVDARDSLLNLAGRLFAAGCPINVQAVNADGSMKDIEMARMVPDLPKYPFNHSQTYWLESRLMKNYRQRDAIRHEILGLPVTDWNPLMPRWRHTIRSGDHPWLKDHQLDGTLLYPGAGMLAMIVEAARYMAKFKPQLVLKGYRFREVTIHSALVVPTDGTGVEVQVYMQNQRNERTTGITTIECREFHLSGYVGGEWKGICSGSIMTEYADQPAGIYDPAEDEQRTKNWAQGRLQDIVDNCPARASEERVYRMGQKIGFEFGPTFQTLSEISYDPEGRHSVATVSLDDWITKLSPTPSVERHVIHPTALDGVLQTMSVMINRGGTKEAPLHAPTQFKEIWISHDLFNREENTKIRVGAKTTRYAVRDLDASITALNAETQEPALTIDGYRVTTLSTQFYQPSEPRNLFCGLEWKPDVELLDPVKVEEYCVETAGKRLVWDPEQQVVCLYYLANTLEQMDREGFKSNKEHLRKYQEWIRYHLQGLGDGNPLLHSPWKERLAPENKDNFMAQFIAKGRVEKALHDFCSQLPQIIREEVDPLHLLFNEGLANDIYSDDVFVYTGLRAAAFVALVAHKNPNMDILEIGAGTGTATDPILESLLPGGDRRGTPKYNSYTFTDISPSFFEKAEGRLAHHADRMIFKVFDAENDPTRQGFEKGKYDMVVAAAVLHATANIKETLRNAHSLLKPGGYLVLVEPTNKWGTVSDSVWGTLSGWWRSTEDDRQHGPLYSRPEWDVHLKNTGFTGIESSVPDHAEEKHHTLSLIVSRAAVDTTQEVVATSSRSVTIMAGTERQERIASEMASIIKEENLASACEVVSPTSMGGKKMDILVSLLELEDPIFGSMTDANLAMIKKAVDSASQIYWLTCGAGPGAAQPIKAMASGFSRAITQEHPGLWFANVDVDDVDTATKNFMRILKHDAKMGHDRERELDYHVSSDQVITIPRAVEAGEINEFVHSQTGQLPIETRTVGKAVTHNDALELQYSIGQLESFRFVRDESVHAPLSDDEIEVEIKATGVNFIDVMVLLGQLAGTHFGCEYSGVVSRVGSAVENLKLGDRVAFLGEDGFRSFVRCKAVIAAKIPDSLPFTEVFAAVYLTTIHSLNHVADLRKGESILVHAAAGGVGQAAIQLAQHIGADVFVTVSSKDKKKLMTEHYGIPENRIFYSRNLSFGRQIRQATGGRGVDVVLNSTSGEALAESFRLLAPLGRFVEIGKRDIHTFQHLPMSPFLNNVSYHAVNTKSVEHARPDEMRDLVLEMEQMLADGVFNAPHPVSVFARGQFESAIRYLQSGKHMGKAVVEWETESEIPVVPSPDPATKLDPNASYVIAGGLGGIGRSMATWFGSRGVKHLILLSRSGPTTNPQIKLVDALRARGVNVATPQCDVSDLESLKGAIREVTKTMPPVKGVIQASMVLKDRVLQNMTLDEWQAVMGPKINGTWNLHHVLPSKMDFFVMLSSTGGMIGSTGQSQYNAASTFQDAFARHRWSIGEKCVSVDVGVVQGVGYVAEHSDISKRWNETKIQVLGEQELLAVIDWACSHPGPANNSSSPWTTQVISGAGPVAKVDSHTLDALPYLQRPLFRTFRQMNAHLGGQSQTRSAEEERPDYGALLRATETPEEAGAIVSGALAKKLARALSVPEEDIDTSRPAHSYGVDSLVAVELRFWFSNEIKADVSVFNILANDPILALGKLAAERSELLHAKEKE